MQKLGRYEVLGELGRGAMGVVYRARDPVIDRVVAIKTIDPKLSGDALAHFREGFFREARSAGRLNHPCIVTIYDAGEADDVAFIAMEVLGGPTLRETLDERSLSVSRAVDIAMQVAYGLSFAHEHGVIHRDIKPANIVLVGKRRVKIADFGIAEIATAASTVVRQVAGSPKYMSPEQIKGGEIDGRSDVFSLGAVAYEMLTGRPPFGGDSLNAIMFAVLESDPPPPSAINRRVPPDLDAIVMRMLAKSLDERYANARALYRELRQWQKSRGQDPEAAAAALREKASPAKPAAGDDTVVLPPPAEGAQRLPTWRRAAIGAGAITLLVSAMAAWWIAGRESAEKEREAATLAARVAASPVPPPLGADPPPSIRDAVAPPPAPAGSKPPEAAADTPKPAPRVVRAPPKPAPVASAAAPAPAPAAEPEPVREPPPAAPPPPAAGTIQLAIAPWGQVYIDGKFRGVTPPMTALEVPPGRHSIEIVYHTMPAFRTEVRVDAGATQRIAHRFE
ncbi:MAG: protein kinase [Burkholderiales bacterium]|jgi:serine/threonine-protein kinase|nr:protein kinase [Burkholderiales bacterium]